MRPRTEAVESLRHVGERIELRIWSWLPHRVRKRLTTYGLAEFDSHLPAEQRGEANSRELLDAVARADRGGEAGPSAGGFLDCPSDTHLIDRPGVPLVGTTYLRAA